MVRLILTFLAVYVAFVIETTFVDTPSMRPYLPAIAIVWCASLRNSIAALLMASGAAIICDVQNSTPLGLHVLPVLVLTWTLRTWWTYPLQESRLFRWCAVVCMASVLLVTGPAITVLRNPSAWDSSSAMTDLELLLTRAFATLIVSVLFEMMFWSAHRILYAKEAGLGDRIRNRWLMLTN